MLHCCDGLAWQQTEQCDTQSIRLAKVCSPFFDRVNSHSV